MTPASPADDSISLDTYAERQCRVVVVNGLSDSRAVAGPEEQRSQLN